MQNLSRCCYGNCTKFLRDTRFISLDLGRSAFSLRPSWRIGSLITRQTGPIFFTSCGSSLRRASGSQSQHFRIISSSRISKESCKCAQALWRFPIRLLFLRKKSESWLFRWAIRWMFWAGWILKDLSWAKLRDLRWIYSGPSMIELICLLWPAFAPFQGWPFFNFTKALLHVFLLRDSCKTYLNWSFLLLVSRPTQWRAQFLLGLSWQ